MKFSYNILKQLVPELSLPAEQLAEELTMHSFETVIERVIAVDKNIIAVQIIGLEPHPNADRLRLATVTDGTTETQVVCGAPNIQVGQVVPYSPPGTNVFDENGKLFTLSIAKIRGVESPGMLNSARELGLSNDHGGIVVLPEETKPGTPLHDLLLDDVILDIDVLPDRTYDAGTHVGMAQEISALMNIEMQTDSVVSDTQQVYIREAGLTEFGRFDFDITYDYHIQFNPDMPSRMAGTDISHEEVKNILERLRFVVSPTWQVSVPSDRPDVQGSYNLVDEVVRMYGLSVIPVANRLSATPKPVASHVYWEDAIRNLLVNIGFTETYSYSFEDEKFAKMVNSEIHPHIELVNPMAPELKNLRYSMLPGLISAMIKSKDDIHRTKQDQERALFEIGRVYHVGDGGVVPGVIERKVIAGIVVGGEEVLQNVFDEICALFKIGNLSVIPANLPAGRQGAGIQNEDDKSFAQYKKYSYADEFFGIGYVFNQELLKKMKYRMPVIAFEISFSALLKHAPDVEISAYSLEEVRANFKTPNQFIELPKFPSIFRDISMLVDPAVSIDAVESEIVRIGGQLVVDVDLFDEYTPLPLPEGELEGVGASKKSLAFHLEYRSDNKTLTDGEILEIHKKIEHALKKEFGAEVR